MYTNKQHVEIIKELSGHSGCVVVLIKKNDALFVRKVAGSANYNQRLKRQFIKQRKFSLKFAYTPEISEYGYVNNLFFFDMEFISGFTLAEYMCNIKVKEIVDFMKILFLSLQIKKGYKNKKAQIIFQDKITELQSKIKSKSDIINLAFDKLQKYDFSKIPCSPCCGDLTLENIIIAPTGKIYLIDLLDSFYNSWMIDVAKLLQDIDLGWSYRDCQKDYNLNLRLEIAKQALFENILQLENGKFLLNEIYHILLLNILRIYPYATEFKTVKFLNKSICCILKTIRKMES